MDEQQKDEKFIDKHPAISFFVGLTGVLIFLSLINGLPSSNSSISDTNVASNGALIDATGIVWRRKDGYINVEGEVKNIGTQQLGWVEASIVFRDKNGKFVTSNSGYLESKVLLSGQASTFHTSVQDEKTITFFSVTFIGKIGDSNNDVEIPQLPNTEKTTPVGGNNESISKPIPPKQTNANVSPVSNSILNSDSLGIKQPVIPPSFQTIHMEDYAKNPPQYSGQGVKILNGLIDDFLAAGDRGGTNNYIEVLDASDPSMKKMMLQIDGTNYQTAVSSLKNADFVIAYGVGIKSQSFTSASGQQILIPTIKVSRLDKCDPYACGNGNAQPVF